MAVRAPDCINSVPVVVTKCGKNISTELQYVDGSSESS